MSELTIRILTPCDWALYKAVRLSSLQDSPDAFGSTYEREATFSAAEWQTRLDLQARALEALPLIAEMDGKAVGLAWGLIHAPDLETAHLYQMWTSPAQRGKGIARSLLSEIKSWATGRRCKHLMLAVTTGNAAAVGLYRAAGFMPTGQLEQLRVGSALMVQPMLMALGNAT